MKTVHYILLITLITVFLNACGQSAETNSDQVASTTIDFEENEREDGIVDNGNRNMEENTNDTTKNERENVEFEKYIYQGARPNVGIEVTSIEEDIKKDLEGFYKALEDKEYPEHTKDYTFYVKNVLAAVQQRVTVDYHYRSFMKTIPERIRSLKRLELETKEVEFIRKHYLEAMEIHHKAVATLDGRFSDIHNQVHDPELEADLYTAVEQGYHYLALASIQLVKIAEDTSILDINEMNETEEFIEEFLIEDQI
ncbi:hypothetical protein ACJ2A9_19360 [Anaerobacillus sp. MEB173]|uniref:hypothetical protein n=1 Tax=Anaerobacillus sp. MEB173 TaxID=3383345 RepID=UPI003F916297